MIAVSAFAALAGFLFLNTLYLQDVRGMSALDAGLHLLPMAAMALVCAPLSGRMVGSRGPRLPLLLAGVATTASGVMFAALDATGSDARLFTAYVLFGMGFGFVNAPITNTAVSGMPRTQAGVAAAVASTSRQVGQSLGVAVMGAAFAAGLDLTAWWIVTGCGVAILTLGWLTSGHWAAGTAVRAAERLSADAAREPVGVR